jgi:hypothetical protein
MPDGQQGDTRCRGGQRGRRTRLGSHPQASAITSVVVHRVFFFRERRFSRGSQTGLQRRW